MISELEKLKHLKAYVDEHPVEFIVAGGTQEDMDAFINYYNLANRLMPDLIEGAELLEPLADYAVDATPDYDPLPRSVAHAYAVNIVLRGE